MEVVSSGNIKHAPGNSLTNAGSLMMSPNSSAFIASRKQPTKIVFKSTRHLDAHSSVGSAHGYMT